MTIAPPAPAARLLHGAGSPEAARLAGHLRRHGPLPLPGRGAGVTPGRLLVELEHSGLVGRGGAGFPTAVKAQVVAAAGRGRLARRPVVVANVLEGEPASAKDRVLATTAPHLIVDGAQVLAAVIGAEAVVVCVARRHREAASSLETALAERRSAGIDPVDTRLAVVPAGYVSGEESALADLLNRGMGRPSYRPQRPAVVRVGARPALIDNAETLAHVALIARNGAEWFRTAGTPDTPGTALVTVSGAVARRGVYEIELGNPLSWVLETAGAVADPPAVLVGGYGGTWLAPVHLGVPLAAASLHPLGASLGAGVVVALPPGACGIAETARIAAWMAGESAGQCGPCVFGLPAIAADLADLASGHDAGRALDRLTYRLGEVDGRGACRHPDFVVRLIRSALDVFGRDVDRHVRSGRGCPGAGAPSVLALPARDEPAGTGHRLM